MCLRAIISLFKRETEEEIEYVEYFSCRGVDRTELKEMLTDFMIDGAESHFLKMLRVDALSVLLLLVKR